MKTLVTFVTGLMLVAGCGAERTVEVTFHEEELPKAATPVLPAPAKAATPPPQVVPDSIHIEAKLSDVNLQAKREGNKFRSVARFNLTLAQFSGGFTDALNLTHAESFKFRSRYDKGCKKSGFSFSAISPNEPSSNEFTVVEPEFEADCNKLFSNITKDMRVEFTNVPLVKDRTKVVPFVSLHMIP